ncbi:MAG: hypothetical protein Q8K36_01110 [Alphaproteobacteria bacterium]|nr:hypothetical protein [Alphaproteobacteria bacterium]
MIKKTFLLFTSAVICVYAKPYCGIQVSLSNESLNLKIKGNDSSDPGWAGVILHFNPTYTQHLPINAPGFGLLAGYAWPINHQYAFFTEFFYTYHNKKIEKNNIDMMDATDDHYLGNESVSIRKRHQYGLLAGVESKITDSLFGILGCGVTLTQYDASAHHVAPNGMIRPENARQNTAYVMAFEPTLGVRYHINDGVSARLLAGYSLGKQKKVLDNYVRHQTMRDAGVSNRVWIKPRGLKVSLALIKQFG